MMLVCVTTLNYARFKTKRHINVKGMASTGRSITITLEAKENLMKHSFILNFIFNV